MELQRPTFNNINETKSKQTAPSIDKLQGSSTKITAPKVATNAKKKVSVIVAIILIIITITVACLFIFTNKDVKQIKDISIKLDSASISFDFVGNDSDITIGEDGLQHMVVLPGKVFKGQVGISSIVDEEHPELAGDVFVRYRLEAYIDDNYYGDVLNTASIDDPDAEWFDDGRYIYYNDVLSPNSTISSNVQIVINHENTPNSFQSKTLKIVVTFQVLQASNHQSINEMWVEAPNAWKSAIIKKVDPNK